MSEFSLDIKFGTPLHTRICDAMNARYTFSSQRMSSLHTKWRRGEDLFSAFAPEKDADAARRAQREVGGKPQYTTIVLPYTYAQLMSAHSYWTTVFLARDPIFQLAGRHGETEAQVQAMEALLAYQVQVGEMMVPFFFWLLDAGKFGIGVMGDYWTEERHSISRFVEVEDTFGDPLTGETIGLGTFKKKLVSQERRGYYGNKLFNIRPYDYFPDTRVPLHSPQRGEFWGHHSELGWHEIVRLANAGEWVNADVLKKKRMGATWTGREEGGRSVELPNDQSGSTVYGNADISETGPYGIVTMEMDIVPRDWGLSDVGVPEKWVFSGGTYGGGSAGATGTTRNIEVVTQARPIGCDHGKFRVDVIEMEPEPYALGSRSLPQVVESIQNTMDWLINSHMYAVRKTMNNRFLADPSRVIMSDFADPNPQHGGAIRARPAAYGSDLRTALQELPVTDLTRAHMSDLGAFDMFAQKASGVNEQLMGQVNSGGRKTAQEIRTSSTFGINRQKTICEFYSVMGFTPMVQKLIANTQQYYDASMKLRLVGDLSREAGPGFIQVDPESITGFYDFVPVDGTLPIDRFQMASLWQQMFAQIARVPDVMMQYDISRIFAYVAQLMGLRNINRFKIVVAQPGQTPEQAAGGNVVNLRDPSMTPSPTLPGVGRTG